MDPLSPRFAPSFVTQSSSLIDVGMHPDLGDPTNPALAANFINQIGNTPAGYSQSRSPLPTGSRTSRLLGTGASPPARRASRSASTGANGPRRPLRRRLQRAGERERARRRGRGRDQHAARRGRRNASGRVHLGRRRRRDPSTSSGSPPTPGGARASKSAARPQTTSPRRSCSGSTRAASRRRATRTCGRFSREAHTPAARRSESIATSINALARLAQNASRRSRSTATSSRSISSPQSRRLWYQDPAGTTTASGKSCSWSPTRSRTTRPSLTSAGAGAITRLRARHAGTVNDIADDCLGGVRHVLTNGIIYERPPVHARRGAARARSRAAPGSRRHRHVRPSRDYLGS